MEHQTTQIPRLMLAASASGNGKTLLTCALLQAALSRGLNPCAYKCGPDYIDPLFHRDVLGLPSRNLDLFYSDESTVRGLLAASSAGYGVAILEGSLGFYDGIAGTDQASSWHLARATDTPVVLTLVPRGASLTVAAILRGVKEFRSPSQIRGILLNQCQEPLFRLLAPVLERETGIPVLGYVPPMPECSLAGRNMGLVTDTEVDGLLDKITRMANQMEETVDVDALLAIADSAPPLTASLSCPAPLFDVPVRIAVARDLAFNFYYEDNLELLEAMGAELVEFSPMRDTALPEGICGLYLGGGYPELYAGTLSQNQAMREKILFQIQRGMPTLAECGGFLYLQEWFEDEKGAVWPMVGALEGHGHPASVLNRYGYVTVKAIKDTVYLKAGESIAAHEFHCWDSTVTGTDCQAVKPVTGIQWSCFTGRGGLFAGFPHLYFRSNLTFATRFVQACGHFKEELQ